VIEPLVHFLRPDLDRQRVPHMTRGAAES
jgi:hypothetical protein